MQKPLTSLLSGSQMDLREYSEKVQQDLTLLQQQSVNDYLESQTEILELHSQITSSCSMLDKIENMLTDFKKDLSGISSEIQKLQDRSLNMAVQLSNRKNIEGQLDLFLQKVVLPPDLIYNICEKEINEEYIEYVNNLLERLKFFESYFSSNSGTTPLATQEVFPEIQKLKTKAIIRVRGFLLALIHNLKKPKTNVQVLQQNIVLKFKDLLNFLHICDQEIYSEIGATYVEVLSQIYAKHFHSYFSSLKKLLLDSMTKNDMIVSQHENQSYDVFALKATRKTILEELEIQNPIVYHSAVKYNEKYYIERIFQSVSRLLADTASSEYFFICEFFNKFEGFENIFEKVFQNIITILKQMVGSTFDCVGILLMLRINQGYSDILVQRNVPILNSYFDKINQILWPRLLLLLDEHIQSLERAKNISVENHKVHNVTRRYAFFTGSLFKIIPLSMQSTLKQRLQHLRKAMVDFLENMSQIHFLDQKTKAVFVLNNIDFILEMYQQFTLPSNDDMTALEQILHEYTDLFIQHQIHEVFKELINFVKSGNKDVNLIEQVGNNFQRDYQKGVALMQQLIKDLIVNQENMKQTRKQCLTKLMLHYSEYEQIVRDVAPQLQRLIIPKHSLISEFKDI